MAARWPADETAGDKARQVRDNPALDWAARVGVAAYGVVHLVVAWLAAQVALGDGTGNASGQGALHQLAQQPFGTVVLWVAAAGFAALSVWEAFEVVGGHRDLDGKRRTFARLSSGVRMVIFGVLAVVTVQVVSGSSGGGSSRTDSYTAELMRMPLGPALVVAVGLGVVGYGCYSAYKGISDRWRRELEPEGRTGDTGTALRVLARIGFVSRGVAFALIGGLFVWAGLTHDAQKSGGLDQALVRLREAPLGPALLLAIAAGLACYGVFNIAKAWYLREW